jgi:predicted ATPase
MIIMINKIVIQNFFSFGNEQTIELNADTNILVGINGSGKSNFIKAIRLLQEGIKGNLSKLFSQKWSGFSSVSNFTNPNITETTINYHFDGAKVDSFYGAGFGIKDEIIYHIHIVKNGLSDFILFEKIMVNGSELEIDYPEPFVRNELILSQLKLSFGATPILYILKGAINSISIYDYFDTSFDGNLRQLSPYYSEENLLQDGKNLTALLSFLNGNSVKAFDKIIDELKNVNPNFKELVFTTPMAGKSLLSLKEKNLDRAITIEYISDGTLRYLLLLSIFYNPNRGSIVCIDEPEAGLHPDMINGIAKGIKHAAQDGTQMIIATHSPLLLNAFELEDLMIFEKDEENQTVVKVKSEEDFPDWQGEFLTGQMWLRGELGGVRW